MATMPNSEIGGYSPAELKFGSSASKYFLLPHNLDPGHSYNEYIMALDEDLSTIRAITARYQLELRGNRQKLHPEYLQNKYQPGDFILSNKVAPQCIRFSMYTVVKSSSRGLRLRGHCRCLLLARKAAAIASRRKIEGRGSDSHFIIICYKFPNQLLQRYIS